jgi:hypothetical protein
MAAFEVVRPASLDDAIRRFVDAFNNHNTEGVRLTFAQEAVNGRSWNSVTGPGVTLYWTYDRGYLIASTDRALAARAIQIRESGASLVRSLSFQERFPATGSLHHSGFVWLNTNGVLADLAGLVQSPAVKNLLGSRDPMLVTLDGETERIRAASRNRLTSVLLDAMLIGGAGGTGKL